MPMRTDCKHYESRTYASGDTVRKCGLGLAPEAPWRCPDACDSYARRLADVNWSHGSLVTPPAPAQPDAEGVAEVLREAKGIVNAAAADVVADLEADQRRGPLRRALARLTRRGER